MQSETFCTSFCYRVFGDTVCHTYGEPREIGNSGWRISTNEKSVREISHGRFFRLWVLMDSNHRSRKTADLQSAPFGHSGKHPCSVPFLLCKINQYFRNGKKKRDANDSLLPVRNSSAARMMHSDELFYNDTVYDVGINIFVEFVDNLAFSQ